MRRRAGPMVRRQRSTVPGDFPALPYGSWAYGGGEAETGAATGRTAAPGRTPRAPRDSGRPVVPSRTGPARPWPDQRLTARSTTNFGSPATVVQLPNVRRSCVW